MAGFTWIPLCEEIGTKLLQYRTRQAELVQMLRDAGVQAGLVDNDANGAEILLNEIDPFTFMGMINKHKSTEKRLQVLGHIKTALKLSSPLPSDFDGVPNANAQATWFFGYKNTRVEGDISKIWDLFEAQQNNAITADKFDAVLDLKWIGEAKLTQALFWYQPLKYLPIDAQTKPFLKNAGLTPSAYDFKTYMQFLPVVKEKFPGKEFYELSHEAWKSNQNDDGDTQIKNEGSAHVGGRFWVFAPGNRARLFSEMWEKGIIALGWDDLGYLKNFGDKSAIQKALLATYNYDTTAKNDALACYDFAFSLRVGDVIIAKEGKRMVIGYARVTSDYRFEPDRTEYKHVRDAVWLSNQKFEVPEDQLLPLKTLTLMDSNDEVVRLVKASMLTMTPGNVGKQTPIGRATQNYWWLNANPKHWNFTGMQIGDTEVFTSHNKDGNQRQIQRYYSQVKPGDKVLGYVASPLRQVVAECIVEKPLGPTPQGMGFVIRKTHTFVNPISLQELRSESLLDKCEPILHNQGTIFSLKEEEFALIREMLDDRNDEPEKLAEQPYTLKDCLSDLFMNEQQMSEALTLLRHKKNLVLQGPPGVGKTFVAKRLAYLFLGVKSKQRIETIQFHQSYSYEDFIQGIRPTKQGGFETKDGIFCRFCKRAEVQPNQNFVFIIDELNRGNLSKIFGEAMMLLEADKRGEPVVLANAEDGDTFTVPPNVYIIGTMNTADRSLAVVDYALRRRFCFLDIFPAFDNSETKAKFELYMTKQGVEKAITEKIISKIAQLNEAIRSNSKDLGCGYEIGHSYFCFAPNNKYDNSWYQTVIKYEIAPLLKEYWFDDPKKAVETVQSLL